MTATYPTSPDADPTPGVSPLELEIDGPDSQRRLTVAFRLLLIIPQFVAMLLLGIAALFVMIIGWFGALAIGRLPEFAERYLSNYLRYSVRVSAYLYLLVDRYPPFSLNAPDYPARVELQTTQLNRLAVLFRIILIIPAYIVTAVLGAGWSVCAFFLWLTVLINGRAPATVFGATAAVVRYSTRAGAYFMMLTSSYPGGVFGDAQESAQQTASSDGAPEHAATPAGDAPRGTRPLILTKGARVLLIVFIALGILSEINNVASTVRQSQQHQLYVQPGGEIAPH